MATANFNVSPEDGWVKIADDPDFIRVSGYPYDHPYYLTTTSSGAPAGAIAATGTFTFSGQPNNGGTVTVGDITYTFVTNYDDPGAYDIRIGNDQAATEAALTAAVNGRSAIPAVAATGSVTFSGGVPAAAQTLDIGDETYTFVATATDPFDVEIGADETETGDNLVAALAADSELVSGVNAAGVVTLTALTAGFSGNSIGLSTNADNTAVSGANMTGGQDEGPAIAANESAFATDGSGLVTITASIAGVLGNSVGLSENATNIVASGSGFLTGGTDAVAGVLISCKVFWCNVPISGEVYVRTPNPISNSALRVDVFTV